MAVTATAQHRQYLLLESRPTPASAILQLPQNPNDPLELIRSRDVALHPTDFRAGMEQLRSAMSSKAPTAQTAAPPVGFLLNLFPDTSFAFQPESFRDVDGGDGWLAQGPIAEPAGAYAFLSYYRGALSASVRMANGEQYQVFVPSSGAGDVRQVRFRGYPKGGRDYVTVDESALPEVLPPNPADPLQWRGAKASADGPSPLASGTLVTLDVLIAYTARTSSQRGGHSGVVSYANLVLAQANQVFANSDVLIHLNLVHAAMVDLQDGDVNVSYSNALETLRGTNDGAMDEVHALRDQYGADVVSLWISPPIPWGTFVVGLAYVLQSSPSSFASYAFSVVHEQYADGPSFSFAHELGHNLGLAHDEDNGGAVGLHADARGYQQKVHPPKFFTVMAYENGCDGCIPIPHFSNDHINYQFLATGVTDRADAARTLQITGPAAAGWRTSAPQPCKYDVSPEAVGGGSAGGNFVVRVSTSGSCPWTAVSNTPWLRIPPNVTGTGNGEFVTEMDSNPTYYEREGTLTVAGKTVRASQSARYCAVSLSTNRIEVGSEATTAFVDISSDVDCPWSSYTHSSWVRLTSATSGVRTGRLSFSIEANRSYDTRSGAVYIHPNKTVSIQQAAWVPECTYSLEETSRTVSPIIDSYSLRVSTHPHCQWSAVSNASWITLKAPTSRTGSGSVGFEIAPNPVQQPRVGTITAAGLTYTVTQQAALAPCTYTVTPSQVSVPHLQTDATVQVETPSHCSAIADSGPTWIQQQREPTTVRLGNQPVVLRVSQNKVQSPRSGVVRFGDASVTVLQEAAPPCEVSVSPTLFRVDAREQTQAISIRVNNDVCSWTMTSQTDWIVVYHQGPGYNNANPTFFIKANDSESPRSGTLTVSGTTITVEQEGRAPTPTLSISRSTLSYTIRAADPSVYTETLRLNGNVNPMEARLQDSLPPWISVTPQVVNTPADIAVRIDASALPAGLHEHTLRFRSGSSTASTRVSMNVVNLLPLRVSSRALSFFAERGSNPNPQQIHVQAVTGNPLLRVTRLSGGWFDASISQQDRMWKLETSVNATALIPGTYDGMLRIDCRTGECQPVDLPVRMVVGAPPAATQPANQPHIASGGIVNAASFLPGIAEGAWISIFGQNLATGTRTWAAEDFTGSRMPVTLDGVSVRIDGKAAAVHFISPGQVNVQAPSGIGRGWVRAEITTPNGSDSAAVFVAEECPGFFQFSATGHVAALLPEGTPVATETGSAQPQRRLAAPGDILAIYGTGFGPTIPAVPAGEIFQGAAQLLNREQLSITIGGVPAQIQFAGLTGAGLNQINVVVPPLPSGTHEIVATIAGSPTQFHGKLAVK